MPHAAVITGPGVEAFGGLTAGAFAFGAAELRLDRRGDGLGQLVLEREDIREAAVIALGPDMAAGGGVDELRRDTEPIAAFPHAAFQYIAHAELAADLPDIPRAALVGKARMARDD